MPKKTNQSAGTQSWCAKLRRLTTVSATICRCPGQVPHGISMTCNADAPIRPTTNQSDPNLFGEPESSPPRSQNGLAVRPSIFNKRTPFNHHLNPAGTPAWWPLNTSPVFFATQLYLQPDGAPYSGSKEIANSVGRTTGLHRHWLQHAQYCRWGVERPCFNSCEYMYRQRVPSALASWMRLWALLE